MGRRKPSEISGSNKFTFHYGGCRGATFKITCEAGGRACAKNKMPLYRVKDKTPVSFETSISSRNFCFLVPRKRLFAEQNKNVTEETQLPMVVVSTQGGRTKVVKWAAHQRIQVASKKDNIAYKMGMQVASNESSIAYNTKSHTNFQTPPAALFRI